VLRRLRDFFALSTLQDGVASLLRGGHATDEQVELLEQEVDTLFAEIRPDAVALVGAFNFDGVLELHDSALGTKDGQVYEKLWEWSEKDPANRLGVEAGLGSGATPPRF
jgi:hypothetical protein